jgi:hypothetical protein
MVQGDAGTGGGGRRLAEGGEGGGWTLVDAEADQQPARLPARAVRTDTDEAHRQSVCVFLLTGSHLVCFIVLTLNRGTHS